MNRVWPRAECNWAGCRSVCAISGHRRRAHGRRMADTVFLQPITDAHEDSAADEIAQRYEYFIVNCAGERNLRRVVGHQRQCEYEHVRDTVLEAARDEREHRPENKAELRTVTIRPGCHPNCQAYEPIAQ